MTDTLKSLYRLLIFYINRFGKKDTSSMLKHTKENLYKQGKYNK